MCAVNIYYEYINTNTCMYIFRKYLYLYSYITHTQTHTHMYLIYKHNIFVLNIYTCMCLYLYIHNKYTQYKNIYCVKKLLFWMRLITINHLTVLIFIALDYYFNCSVLFDVTFKVI